MSYKITMSLVCSYLFLAFTSCSNPLSNSVSVRYKVSGTAETVDITYENASGGTSQLSEVELPWSITFEANIGDFVYLSAQNQGDEGSVTVTIYKNGDVFKQSTSEGAYVIATASGTL